MNYSLFSRSSIGRRSMKKNVLNNFAKFTNKNICIRVSFLKKRLWHIVSYKFCEIFKNISFSQHFQTTTASGFQNLRSLFRTLSNIYDETFLSVNYFCKKNLHTLSVKIFSIKNDEIIGKWWKVIAGKK